MEAFPSIRAVHQLVAAQSMLYVFSKDQSLCDFISRNILSIPGVKECTLCLYAENPGFISKNHLQLCRDCPAAGNTKPVPFNFTCPLEKNEGVLVLPLEMEDRCFGNAAIIESDPEKAKQYITLLQNLLSSVTLTVENLIQKEQLREREKHLEILVQKRTKELEKTLEEKKLLLKEVHHRIKNNFNVVISLLSMQSDMVREEAAKNALKESADRVAAMSGIHHFLYKSENYSSIKVKDFFPEILSSLAYSYNSGRKAVIRLLQNIDPVELPIDTAIPCSLIANELVTNSYKHAFDDDVPGGVVEFLLTKKTPGTLSMEVKDLSLIHI